MKKVVLVSLVLVAVLLNQIFCFSERAYADINQTVQKDWHYSIDVLIKPCDFERKNYPEERKINFSKLLQKKEVRDKTFDLNSIRVVEYDGNGNFLKECPSQFEKGKDFDAKLNASGTVSWIVEGTTKAGLSRYYKLYYDVLENGAKPKPEYASGVSVQQKENNWCAENQFYQLTFNPLKGGTLSSILYKNSGTIDNIRRHHFIAETHKKPKWELGSAEIEKLIEGPVKAKLRVTAAYKTPSDFSIKSVSTYTFYNNCPLVRYEVEINQSPINVWQACRIEQYWYQGLPIYTHWATSGEPVKFDKLGVLKPGVRRGAWYSLYNKDIAFGVIRAGGGGNGFVYDYGTGARSCYIIVGHQGSFSTKKLAFTRYLYFGPSFGTYQEMQTYYKTLVELPVKEAKEEEKAKALEELF